jgi:rhamnosyltransferase
MSYKALIKRGVTDVDNITEVTDIISSGMLISIENIKTNGFFEEILFLDYADQEWCWRAKHHKMRIFISENVKLSHQVGEGNRSFCGIDILIPTPFRSFYVYRNFLILLRRNYVPIYWKLSNLLKLFFKMFYLSLFTSSKKQYLKNIFNGIKAGIFLNNISQNE